MNNKKLKLMVVGLLTLALNGAVLGAADRVSKREAAIKAYRPICSLYLSDKYFLSNFDVVEQIQSDERFLAYLKSKNPVEYEKYGYGDVEFRDSLAAVRKQVIKELRMKSILYASAFAVFILAQLKYNVIQRALYYSVIGFLCILP